ncbi:MAG: hypothetical protein IPJ66_13695 [Bacteroidetes bacterium]|nr:hypothetical protein [Bacteroidota bacterium]
MAFLEDQKLNQMKKKILLLLAFFTGVLSSCEKEPLQRDNVMDEFPDNSNGHYAFPNVSDGSVSGIYANGAIFDGKVVSDGGSAVTARGICYNYSGNPSLAFYTIQSGGGTGDYRCILEGLLPGYTYYLRAYATNALGTVYGYEISFTTTR